MPFAVHTGISGPAGSMMTIALILNANGQAITLANSTFGGKVAYGQIDKVKVAVDALKKTGKTPTFAMTFPGGTHDIWLRYWLGACGINPNKDVKVIPIPPPQMVANMKVGNMDGYCVGEPWNGLAVEQKVGFTHLATQDLWKHHPEKALVFHTPFASEKRDETKAIMRAILEASIWLDDMKNRKEAARVIGQQKYVNAPARVIEARLEGLYDLGTSPGKKIFKDDTMLFHRGGEVNFPKTSYGIFYLAQYQRWNMLKTAPDYMGISNKLIAQDLYREVAAEMKIPVPTDNMKTLTGFIDGVDFDPADPDKSILKYKVKG
jgi:nitrate/nitrite transport system substrate-binding protein